jgi:hypothetical protein
VSPTQKVPPTQKIPPTQKVPPDPKSAPRPKKCPSTQKVPFDPKSAPDSKIYIYPLIDLYPVISENTLASHPVTASFIFFIIGCIFWFDVSFHQYQQYKSNVLRKKIKSNKICIRKIVLYKLYKLSYIICLCLKRISLYQGWTSVVSKPCVICIGA